MHTEDYQYGLKDGKLVHVSEVESGKGCGCVCPSCGNPFVAFQGNIVKHHFKHAIKTNCKHAYESALHYLAKEVISQKGYLPIRAESYLLPKTLSYYTHQNSRPPYRYYPTQKITFDKIIIEKTLGNFKPDLECHVGDRVLLIEIAVTHYVDIEKKEKVVATNTPMIEINLSRHKDKKIDFEFLERILYESHDFTMMWVHNPKLEILFQRYVQKTQAIEAFIKNNKRRVIMLPAKRVKFCPILEKANLYKCLRCEFAVGPTPSPHNTFYCMGHKADNITKLLNDAGAVDEKVLFGIVERSEVRFEVE